jgi:hypothetical protein
MIEQMSLSTNEYLYGNMNFTRLGKSCRKIVVIGRCEIDDDGLILEKGRFIDYVVYDYVFCALYHQHEH